MLINAEKDKSSQFGDTLVEAKCGIFIINLDRREDRWKAISNHLNELNCHHFQRVTAVDGLNEPQELAKKVVVNDQLSKYPLTLQQRGALGCLKSHLKALKQASLFFGTIDKALILEDDCFFISNASKVLEKSLAELPSQWQYLMLGAVYGTAPGFLSNKKNLVRVYNASAAHAYMVNKDSCQRLIKRIEKILKSKTIFPVDEIFIKLQHEEKWYATNPLIAGQCTDNFSDITGDIRIHTPACFKLDIKINRKIWLWLKVRPFLHIDLINKMLQRIWVIGKVLKGLALPQ